MRRLHQRGAAGLAAALLGALAVTAAGCASPRDVALEFQVFPAAGIVRPPATDQASDPAVGDRISATYARLPLHFEPNHGQTHESVRFIARAAGYSVLLTSTEAVLVLPPPATGEATTRRTRERGSAADEPVHVAPASPRRSHEPRSRALPGRSRDVPLPRPALVDAAPEVVRMAFPGASAAPQIDALEPLPGRVNYFRGNDPARWRTDIPTFARVRYRDLYPGIDLVYYGRERHIEYDLVVRPGADPGAIRIAFTGARALALDSSGDLRLATAGGEVRLKQPFVYQEVGGRRVPVEGRFARVDEPCATRPCPGARFVAGVHVAAYDRSRPLVIDPVLSYSTFLGGSNDDTAYGIAVDTAGNAYVTGHTDSANFPTTLGASQPSFGGGPNCCGYGGDAFVTKLTPDGSAIVYSTYLGGRDGETGRGIAVDAAGNAYVTGLTFSSNFPTSPSAFQPTFGGGRSEAFVTKLNPDGSALVYSTYLGGATSTGAWASPLTVPATPM